MTPEPSHSARRLSSLAACLAGAGVLITLATAFVLLYYACPSCDDYYRAGIVRDRPWYVEIARNYFFWTGRWSGVGLALVIHPRVDLVRWYPILLMALVVFQALGLRAFWRMLLGGTATRRQVLGLIAATMAVLWAGLPSPGETWYWMSGGLENHLNIFLSLLLIGGLVQSRWEEMSHRRARARTAALAMLALFVTGIHETIAGMLLLILVPGTVIARTSGQSTPRRRAWEAVCLSAVVGFAIVAFAPGNVVRSAVDLDKGLSESQRGLIRTLELTRDQAWHEVPSWVLDVRLLAATLVLVLSPFFARARAGELRWGGISPRLVVTTIWLLGITAMFLGPISVIHRWMPPRTVSSAYTLFVLGWITAVFVWTRSRAESGDSAATALEAVGPRFARTAALAVLGLSLLVTGNTRDGIAALWNGVPQTWHRMVHWRDHGIQRAAREGAIDVDFPMHDLGGPNLARYPKLYNFYDLSEDSTYFVNNAFAAYYGLRAVRRVPPDTVLSAKAGRRREVVGLKSDGAPSVKQ
jgi:hypothetical protein